MATRLRNARAYPVQGRTREEAISNIKEAIEGYIAAERRHPARTGGIL